VQSVRLRPSLIVLDRTKIVLAVTYAYGKMRFHRKLWLLAHTFLVVVGVIDVIAFVDVIGFVDFIVALVSVAFGGCIWGLWFPPQPSDTARSTASVVKCSFIMRSGKGNLSCTIGIRLRHSKIGHFIGNMSFKLILKGLPGFDALPSASFATTNR
jgi:hypothetical protein